MQQSFLFAYAFCKSLIKVFQTLSFVRTISNILWYFAAFLSLTNAKPVVQILHCRLVTHILLLVSIIKYSHRGKRERGGGGGGGGEAQQCTGPL